jgi:SAM-dependent methyltransferase
MIEVGRKACDPAVEWVQGDAFALPEGGPFASPFDMVYTFRFIRHFERGDRARLYAQIARVLRPGGWLVMDAVNAEVSGPLRAEHPEDYPIYDKLYQDLDELSEEMKEAGFSLVGTVSVQRSFPLAHRVQCLVGPRSRWLNRQLIRTIEHLSRGPGLEWVVTCRRG